MKETKMKWAVIGGLAIVMLPSPASADETGNPAENGAAASVEVVEPLEIESESDLYFGAFIKGPTFASGNRIIVEGTTGDRSTPGTLNSFHFLASYPHYRAMFRVSGVPNHEINIYYPTPANNDLGPGMELQNINVHNAYSDPHSLPAGNGEELIPFGGTLKVTDAGNVQPGTYSAVFTVTVQYD